MSFSVLQNVHGTIAPVRSIPSPPLRCWWCKTPIAFRAGVPFAGQFLTRPISRGGAASPDWTPTRAMTGGFTNAKDLKDSGQGFGTDVASEARAGHWIGKGIFCDLSCLLGLITVEGWDVPLLAEYLRERGGGEILAATIPKPFPPLGYWPSPLLVSNSEMVLKEGRVSTYLMFGHTSSVTSDTASMCT
jgi:hypothetical protein